MWNSTRLALSIGAVALFAGCGVLPLSLSKGQDDTLPLIGTPGVTTQADGNGSSSFRVLHRFGGRISGGGAVPNSPLLNVNGVLYGTTLWSHSCFRRGCGNGTVFTITTTGVKKVIYNFKGGSDGAAPSGPLIDVNGTLYGTTSRGGGTACDGNGCGTVYSLSTSGSERVVYSFAGGLDGAGPSGGLVNVNGTLYGTTGSGGSSVSCGNGATHDGCGTVYSVSTSGSERVLHAFEGSPDGARPGGGLIAVNGTLYGTTSFGGKECGTRTIYFPFGCGIVYSISTSGAENVLYRFTGKFGEVIPSGGLLAVHGTLYGMTNSGFVTFGGVYKISLSGVHKVVYYFKGPPDAGLPNGNLIGINGVLYGTTSGGGTSCPRLGCGTVFSLTTSGSETVLHSFTGGSNGAYPQFAVTDVNGTLYGATGAGGHPGCDNTGCGIVFSLGR